MSERSLWLNVLNAGSDIAGVSIPPISELYLQGQRFALHGAGSDEDSPEFLRGYSDMQDAMIRFGVKDTPDV